MKLSDEQWKQAREMYIYAGASYRDLADRYGVSLSTVYARGKKENWTQIKQDLAEKTNTQTQDVFIADAADRAQRVAEIFDRFCLVLSRMAEYWDKRTQDGGLIGGKELGGYLNALKNLKEIGEIRTEAQIREQNARIALLERQAAAQTGTDGACITVTFEGVDGCET